MGLVLLIVAGVSGAYLYARVINGLFTRTNVSLTPASGKALNVLLVGSDSREGLSDPLDVARFGAVGGKRADTIIVAQIIPREQRGVLLHLPRDMYLTIHENGQEFKGKVNSAYQYGPQAMVDTIGALTGLPINHYMEIDIRGFRRMVDAIGGIDVCMNQSLYDSQLNFKLSAGVSHLDGNTALSFVRARHATPDGDFGRIKRQQQFIRTVMAKVGRPSVLGNPVRVNGLARAFAQNIKVDQFFQLEDLVRFALSVRKVGPDQLETFSVPGNVGYAGGQSVVFPDTQKAEPIFQAMREIKDPSKVLAASQPQQPVAPKPKTATRATHTAAAASPCPPSPS